MSVIFGTLCSGSEGNCTLFHNGQRGLLIDAGRTRKYIIDTLNLCEIPPESVKDIFVTHSHGDHVKALQVLTKKLDVSVHCSGGTAGSICDCVKEGCLDSRCRCFDCDCGDIHITSFATSHDTPGSVGYRIDWQGRSFGYATDLGVFTEDTLAALSGCECVVLESNHDPDMLMNGPYEYGLKLRIASDKGHLSNFDAGKAALALAKSGTKRFILAHISKENNTPVLALNTVRAALKEGGYTAVPADIEPEEKEIALCVAMPESPVLLEL